MKEINNSCKYSCNLPDTIVFKDSNECKIYQRQLAQMGYNRWENTFYRGGHSFQHQTGYAKCNLCEPNLFQLSLQALPKVQRTYAGTKRMNYYNKQKYFQDSNKI